MALCVGVLNALPGAVATDGVDSGPTGRLTGTAVAADGLAAATGPSRLSFCHSSSLACCAANLAFWSVVGLIAALAAMGVALGSALFERFEPNARGFNAVLIVER